MTEMTGGCQCGRIRYTAEIDSDDAYLCHCRMCQRATGGVAAAFRNAKRADVRWEREPDLYASSPIARRGFCSACGTPLTFEYVSGSDKIDLTVGSFDDPSRFRPISHFGIEHRHDAWFDTRGLPGHRCDEYQALVDRWREAGQDVPE
ncbi:GFA family protein [Sphingomonas sp. CL5.1]|uniref:GFA family protein n=1 Tax=Sphingomonas sp. CL5.1 TaxID=2653203 RepID=UPI001583A568|nr:GFA family protein [Sphingomonas sp. CL5.1]QKS00913.1 GFA family protein [Sphingomonas sp. CL5.1]